MKKFLCIFTCLCIVFPFSAGRISAQNSDTVLFDYDFEQCALGQSIPRKADVLSDWSAGAESKTAKIRAVTDDTQGVVAQYSNTSTTTGNIRLEKILYLDGLAQDMTISFKAKSAGTKLTFYLVDATATAEKICTVEHTDWTQVRVALNFTEGTYIVYSGASQTNGTLKNTDYSVLTLRFYASTVVDACAYLDDVLVTTTAPLDPQSVSNGNIGIRTPEQILAPFAHIPVAPEGKVPDGKHTLFAYDCSLNAVHQISTGSEALWTKAALAEPAILNQNKIIRMTNDKRGLQHGSLTKLVATGKNPGCVIVEYYAVLSNSGTYVTLLTGDTDLINTRDSAITKNTPGAVDGWNKITAVFDFEKQVCSLYVNTAIAAQALAFTKSLPADTFEVTIGVHGKLSATDTVLLDNFVFYQDVEPVMDGVKYYGTTGTNWALVTEDVTLSADSYVRNLKQHPRLVYTDRQAILDKIQTDAQTAAWFATCKSNADKFYAEPVYTYTLANDRNASEVIHGVEERLMAWGIAYLVEGDEKYVERGIAEIRNAATFPDWANATPILPSALIYGIACFYDWCYDSPAMTADVKAQILQIVKEKALWQFVRSYDGTITVEIANGTSNRTIVANTCGAAIAIAMADEEPLLAQLLIDGAVRCTKQAVEAYSPDGAFAEGVSYWHYANRHLFDFLDEISGAVTEAYEMPAQMQWYFESEQIKNTPKYWAYMHGPAGNFDYGDNSSGFSAAAQIFWYAQRENKPFYTWYMQRVLQRMGSVVSDRQKAIAYYDPEFAYYNDATMPLDKTFDATDLAQVASMRSSWIAKNALYVALQGGDNAAGHMVNSLGTFVLDANGKRFVRVAGRTDYSAIYPRYMYYTARAEGQNTIVANPGETVDQKDAAIARFICHEEAENEAYTVLDMTETNDAFTSAKRGMYMTKGRNSVVLQDEITTNTPSEIWWFAHTDAEITLIDGGKGALMRIENEKMYATITSGPENAVFTVMDAKPLPTSPVAPDEVYPTCKKLAIHLSEISELTLTVEFVPLRDGEGIPTLFTQVKPISAWSVTDHTIPAKRQAGDALVLLANSLNVLSMEEKFVWDKKDSAIAPFKKDGVLYVPAARAAELVYAKAEVVNGVVRLTRNAVTRTITEDIITLWGVVYVPAQALAKALGMQLYTDASGLTALADKVPAYTAAQKQAILRELSTCVYINDVLFDAFSTEKTTYYIPCDDALPTVYVSGDTAVTQTADTARFTLGDRKYTFYRTEPLDAIATYNVVRGKEVDSDRTMGESYISDYMTDGNLKTRASNKKATEQNITFTIELDKPHYIKEFILTDYRDANGSVMEHAVYSVRLENGTWVNAGENDHLDAAPTEDKMRKNTTVCTVQNPVTAIRLYMENTDAYINRVSVWEFEVGGIEKSLQSRTPKTRTVCADQNEMYHFVTDIQNVLPRGYLLTALYQEEKLVGIRKIPLDGQARLTYSIDKVAFDLAKVFLLDFSDNMRILTEAEILFP